MAISAFVDPLHGGPQMGSVSSVIAATSGPNSAWRWTIVGLGIALIVLAYQEWHAPRRVATAMTVLLAIGCFAWAGFHLSFVVGGVLLALWVLAVLALLALRGRSSPSDGGGDTVRVPEQGLFHASERGSIR